MDRALNVAPPHPQLERLEPLLGTWQSEDRTEDSTLGSGVPVFSTQRRSWLDGGHFLVSAYETVFGDEPARTGIDYWRYDADTERFRILSFATSGPYAEDGCEYEGVVADHRLTFEGPARFQYELDDAGRIRVNADGTISVAWWLRDRSGKWSPWMHSAFTRVGG